MSAHYLLCYVIIALICVVGFHDLHYVVQNSALIFGCYATIMLVMLLLHQRSDVISKYCVWKNEATEVFFYLSLLPEKSIDAFCFLPFHCLSLATKLTQKSML